MRGRMMVMLAMGVASALAAEADQSAFTLDFPALDMVQIEAEDTARYVKEHPQRFAVARDFSAVPGRNGAWVDQTDGQSIWRMEVKTPDAVHLNFGFTRFRMPPTGRLTIVSNEGLKLGPYEFKDNPVTGQLWTPVLGGHSARIEVEVATVEKALLELELTRVGHGYRGFGFRSKHCKSGSCNTDVACLAADDPWNENRRSVAAITVSGTDTCTGSLVNNTNADRRLLFATAAHCSIGSGNVASMLAYFNYESPTCRTPGSVASGQPIPRPSSTLAGQTWLASTNNPFNGGSAPAGSRSDWTLVQLASSPNQDSFNLYWSGWDRRAPPTVCSTPATPSATNGLCASIHHPSVDEKRITFVEVDMTLDNISSAQGVHWRANWDPTPPILPNVPAPQPASLPPSVTEPGSSGSPLYNADRRLVGVLSGGPSSCGATGASLRDQYGGLFHAFDGNATPTSRMRDYLDPAGTNAMFIDGQGQCDPPAVPAGVTAVVNGDNRIDVSWEAVAGAERYRVFRGTGTCPGSGVQQIAEVTTTTYADSTVSGGTVYSYRIAAFDDAEACLSGQSTCSSAQATGACALAPTFAGLSSANSAGQAQCGVNLEWTAAGGNCGAGSSLRYNVYRSTNPDFLPDASNRVSTCQSAVGYSDLGLSFGTTYHYAVRAEDLSASGANGACGGVEDNNLLRRSAVPAGPDTNQFQDDVESGAGSWVSAGTGAGSNWAIVSTQANSGSNSWFVPDPTNTSSRTLTTAAPIAIPASPPAVLEFFHRYATESGYDGGVLEYSLNGGTTWSGILGAQADVPANSNRFIAGGYNGTMNASGAFGAVPAWHGSANTTWIRTAVNLADFAGRNLSLRLRFGSDTSIGGTGWWVDDVRVYSGSSCTEVTDILLRNGFE